MKLVNNSEILIPALLILNLITAVLLALLFGYRLFLALKKLTKGIDDLARMQPVALPAQGISGRSGTGINHASAQLIRQESALNNGIMPAPHGLRAYPMTSGLPCL